MAKVKGREKIQTLHCGSGLGNLANDESADDVDSDIIFFSALFFSSREKKVIFLLLREYHNDVYCRRAHFDEVRVVFSPLCQYHNCVVDDN